MRTLPFLFFTLFSASLLGAFPGTFPSSLGTYELSPGPTGTGSIFHESDTGLNEYCGGDDNSSGPCFRSYGASHATRGGDWVISNAGNTVEHFSWDASSSVLDMNLHTVVLGDALINSSIQFDPGSGNNFNLNHGWDNGSVIIGGGSSVTSGGNGVFYGGSNASSGFILRQGSTARIQSNATGLGFFAASPVGQASHIADAAGDDATAVNAILVVLENLGFVASS